MRLRKLCARHISIIKNARLREGIRYTFSNASIIFNELGTLIRYLETALIKLPRINEEVLVKALRKIS
jgi:hypothetical protein